MGKRSKDRDAGGLGEGGLGDIPERGGSVNRSESWFSSLSARSLAGHSSGCVFFAVMKQSSRWMELRFFFGFDCNVLLKVRLHP